MQKEEGTNWDQAVRRGKQSKVSEQWIVGTMADNKGFYIEISFEHYSSHLAFTVGGFPVSPYVP